MGIDVFPRTYEISPGKMHTIPGISLRQLYAALAMHALIMASGDGEGGVDYEDEAVADSAFEMADAMLDRGQNGQNGS